MNLNPNDLQHLQDLLERGEIDAQEANVRKVEYQRVLLVTGKLPAQVRKALSAGVKSGRLGHMKKDGLKPEAFYHATFDYLAKGERAHHERKCKEACQAILGGGHA